MHLLVHSRSQGKALIDFGGANSRLVTVIETRCRDIEYYIDYDPLAGLVFISSPGLQPQIFTHGFNHSKVLSSCWRGISIPMYFRNEIQVIENMMVRKLLLYPPELLGRNLRISFSIYPECGSPSSPPLTPWPHCFINSLVFSLFVSGRPPYEGGSNHSPQSSGCSGRR